MNKSGILLNRNYTILSELKSEYHTVNTSYYFKYKREILIDLQSLGLSISMAPTLNCKMQLSFMTRYRN